MFNLGGGKTSSSATQSTSSTSGAGSPSSSGNDSAINAGKTQINVGKGAKANVIPNAADALGSAAHLNDISSTNQLTNSDNAVLADPFSNAISFKGDNNKVDYSSDPALVKAAMDLVGGANSKLAEALNKQNDATLAASGAISTTTDAAGNLTTVKGSNSVTMTMVVTGLSIVSALAGLWLFFNRKK